MRPSRNAATATSFAALSTAGAVPPARKRVVGEARGTGSARHPGASKSSAPSRARSSGATPASMRSGHASACAIGVRMSGLPELREHRAVDVLDQRMDDALRMDDDLDRLARRAEQPVRLDHLEALVHHRRRVDRDLAAHRPVRMRARLRPASRARSSSSGARAERPARRGEQDAPHAGARRRRGA